MIVLDQIVLCSLCSLYTLPIMPYPPYSSYMTCSLYTLYIVHGPYAVRLCAVLRMGKVSRYRHGQAIVVGLAKPASMAFVVVVMYRLTAVASLVMPQCDQEHPFVLKDSLMMFSRLDMIGSIFTLHLPVSGWPQARQPPDTKCCTCVAIGISRILQHHIT